MARKARRVGKERIPIPEPLASEVVFESDRTCCVCHQPGRRIQIHHLDDNPANNVKANLAVLCLECHDETQRRGGFGRGLNAEVVLRYRGDWLGIVSRRFRHPADGPPGHGGAFRGFASGGPFSPSLQEMLTDEASKFIRTLDQRKAIALHRWKEASAPEVQQEALAIANDYTFKVYKEIWFVQERWRAVNGRYFQGKSTMPEAPDYLAGGRVDLGVGLTDQVDDWFTVGYSDAIAPVQLRCDVYSGPQGDGYTVQAHVSVLGALWRNQMHIGSEPHRDVGNLQWLPEAQFPAAL